MTPLAIRAQIDWIVCEELPNTPPACDVPAAILDKMKARICEFIEELKTVPPSLKNPRPLLLPEQEEF